MSFSKTLHVDINKAIEALDKTAVPWFFNKSDRPDSYTLWYQYGHLTCYMIEVFYQRYKAGDQSYRQIPLPGGYVLDFKYMMQISVSNPLN